MKKKKSPKRKMPVQKRRGIFPAKIVTLPKTGTHASEEYFTSWLQINNFLIFMVYLVSDIEYMSKNVHEALILIQDDEEKKKEYIKQWETHTFPFSEFKKYRQFLLEVILVRHIENFLNYLSSLLMEIFVQRPETLRSSEKIDLEEALKHDTIEDLVLAVAERKVENLSYSSFQDLYDYFMDKFNLKLFEDSNIPDIVNAIEIRNISVHNRCIINQRFIKRTGTAEDKLGKLRMLYLGYLEKLVPILAESVECIDQDARKKLKLKVKRFQIE